MCGEFISRIFTPPGTGAAEAAVERAALEAKQARDQAASDAAAAAAGDSEGARRAVERKLRTSLSSGGFAPLLQSNNATVGYRQAFGS
jgi:hypothetical protein